MVSFEKVEATLRQLCGTPSAEILWIFRDDILLRRGTIWVNFPLPLENREKMKALLDWAIRNDHPAEVFAVCLLENHLCASVYLAKDPVDAEYRRIEGVKYSCPARLLTAQKAPPLRFCSFWARKLFQSRKEFPFLEDIPRRGVGDPNRLASRNRLS